LGPRLTTLLCEIFLIQSNEKRMANLVKSSKEGYGSKRVVLPMMKMMMMTMMMMMMMTM
jgi:hypothetical protein